ncbi:MAG: hypothetical protein PHH70_05475 [Candidatus Gracilibacteria bacterium]|nr:hypothetical protein [Candidatus Gracilibacteria bacterium]
MAGPKTPELHLGAKTHSTTEKLPSSPKFAVVNGLEIQETPSGKYRIVDESGIVLPFVLQGKSEAIEMQFALARIVIEQETCRKIRDLRVSCGTYVGEDITGDPNLFMKNSNWIPGSRFKLWNDIIWSGPEIAEIVQGAGHRHPLPDGIYPFVAGISQFLNEIHNTQVRVAKNKTNQVAQK